MRNQIIVAAVVLFSIARAASGSSIVNGDFETGDFTGWTVGAHSPPDPLVIYTGSGDNTIDSGGPAGSTKYGHLTFWGGAWSDLLVLTAAAQGKSLATADIEPKFEQTFSASTGSILSFDLKWLVSVTGGGGFDVAILGPNGVEFAYQQFAWIWPGVIGQPSSDWQTFQHTLEATGSYTFRITPISKSSGTGAGVTVFAQVDIGLDNLTLTPVPEPTSLTMLAIAGVLIAGAARFNRGCANPSMPHRSQAPARAFRTTL